MTFEVRTEFGNLDPEAKRALVAMQHAIKGHLDEQDKRNRRPKRPVTELVEEGSVLAKPGQVVRVQPSDEDIQVVLPPSDPGNGGEDIIVSFEGDGTATGKVLVTSASSSCANPATTTLNTPGSYRFTSTGAPSEGQLAETAAWSGPAPVGLEDLPEVAPQRLLGNNTGASAPPTELTASQVLDWVDSTRGTVPYRGAAAWAGLDPGAIELPIVSKGAGADPVYQQLATAGIADDAVTNAKLANMAAATLKLRASGAGTGDPTDGTITQALDMVGSTRGSLLERGASSWSAITPGTSGLPLVSQGAGADPVYTGLLSSAFAAATAKSVFANATNASAVPAFLAGSAAFQYLRVNSANNALEWATLSGHASTSIVYTSDTFVRAALTGDVTASQNANATTIANDAVTNAKAANMATAKLKGRTTTGTGDPEDLTLVNSTTDSWNVGTGGSISIERAALTGEVTASANANACTITRSTNFQSSPWTGDHQFNGQVLLGTVTTSSSTGSINVTLGATSTRVLLSGTGTITVGTMSGAADGRVVVVEFSGTGTHTITHDASTADAFSCPGNVDLVINGRGAVVCLARLGGANNWKIVGISNDMLQGTNTWTAVNTFSSTIALGQKVTFTGPISPTAISADQNDYTPTGWSTANLVRLSTNSGTARTLTGAAAGSAGELKWLVNLGPGDIKLDAASTSSTAANRWLHVSGTTFTISVNGVCGILYDGTSSRWRPIAPNLII
jgi:hypothetical protein